MKLSEAERYILELLWKHGELSAQELSAALAKEVGWKRTTSYTMIERCCKKCYVQRRMPGYLCTALLSEEAVRQSETEELLRKNYSGSADLLVAALAGQRRLSLKQMEAVYRTLQEMEAKE